MRPAVFIDRDGTINEQMGYLNHITRFTLLPRSAEAIRLLNDRQWLAIVVSNQSGVARGYFPMQLVHDVHARMEASLRERGARVDGIFFCPHHPRGSIARYTFACDCRKPGIGLIERAGRQFDIDMKRSCVVGDRLVDVEMAHRCGLRGILVETGYGRGEIAYLLPDSSVKPWAVAEDLLDAVLRVVGEDS